jgi:methionine-S-sulfoxide reductase
VLYDDKEISLEELLIKYLVVVDPTLINRQGPDIGTQYASGVFCDDEEDLKIVRNFFLKKQADYASKIMVKVDKVNSFVKAEEYHQKYLEKNPNGYCHIDRSLFSK